MDTEALNMLVSGAIWRAEQLESHGLGDAGKQAWAEVSALEEKLTRTLAVAEPEGRIARRGAVRAALKAQDYGRADALVAEYLAEDGIPASLKSSLRKMLTDQTAAIAAKAQRI